MVPGILVTQAAAIRVLAVLPAALPDRVRRPGETRAIGTLFAAVVRCLPRYRLAMVGNIVVPALTIACEPRYMPP